MEKETSYVYFALKGVFDAQVITDKTGIKPTKAWNKGDQGTYKPVLDHSGWELSTDRGPGYLMIGELIDELVDRLFDKIEVINELKEQYGLHSVLEIVMYIDTNEQQSTPALVYGLKAIEFLYRTQTVVDIDIYRFNSNSQTAN